jgi:hypothetical protein
MRSAVETVLDGSVAFDAGKVALLDRVTAAMGSGQLEDVGG